MAKYKLYTLNIILITFTVPWFYFSPEIQFAVGFPAWAIYSILTTFIYAIIVFYFLGKYWHLSASEDKENIE